MSNETPLMRVDVFFMNDCPVCVHIAWRPLFWKTDFLRIWWWLLICYSSMFHQQSIGWYSGLLYSLCICGELNDNLCTFGPRTVQVIISFICSLLTTCAIFYPVVSVECAVAYNLTASLWTMFLRRCGDSWRPTPLTTPRRIRRVARRRHRHILNIP